MLGNMPNPNNQNILDVNFENALEERYFAYALSTIKSRSLPDVRDGLKPVHRRLLYAMRELHLDPKSGFKKCARIVGDVIGKFHPHGDASVYDALVRMAQHFSMRYQVIDGQGNFGSIDGDAQAAMRYTEAKLTDYAMFLLQDIDNDTVDFQDNYDGSQQEPCVMPSAVPNLLANGSEGIAVGMATSIPPHNLIELLNALQCLIKNANATDEQILKFVLGPDFPTGGVMHIDTLALANSYKTGKGTFKLRAKWHLEDVGKGKSRIVITEIPYQVNKKKIIEQLAQLYQDKKLPFIETFQDASAEDIRVVLSIKGKDQDPERLMEYLFKHSDLEIRYNMNLNVLSSNHMPKVMSLREILCEFIEHRNIIVTRKLNHRLSKINDRLEILDALLVTFLNLDEVIHIIREEEEPKPVLIERFTLSDRQAEAILNTRLRALKKLEDIAIIKEKDGLSLEKDSITHTLSSNENVASYVLDEFKQIKKALNKDRYKRLTEIVYDAETQAEPVTLNEFIEIEPITVTVSQMAWVKSYKGHSLNNLKYRSGDDAGHVFELMSNEKIIVYTSFGKFYTINADRLPGGRGDGEPLRLMMGLEDKEEIVNILKHVDNSKILLVSGAGKGFLVESNDVLAQTKQGKQIFNLDADEKSLCVTATGQYCLFLGENRRLLVLDIKDIPLLKKGKGVKLQRFKHGALKDIKILNEATEVEALLPKGLQKLSIWLDKRGSYGRLVFGKTWVD